MYDHLFIAFGCWILAATVPSLPEKYLVALTIMGFIAFLLFLKKLLENMKQQLLAQAEEAEHEMKTNLSCFKGKFIAVRNENAPFANDFCYLIFSDGEIKVPLFCRNTEIIQKVIQSDGEKQIMIYYKDYILIDIEEIEETEIQKLPS
ncbi:hypothetical protein ACF5W4_08370 [Bacillota bacterium Lsc_1132]